MVSIGRKNLFHDKKRFTLTWFGVAASILLILFGFGMFTGIVDEVTVLVDNIDADIWVVQEGNKDIVSGPSNIQENITQEVMRIDGVKDLHKLMVVGEKIRKNDKQIPITIIGIEFNDKSSIQWKFSIGDMDNLKKENSIIIDKSIEKQFGVNLLGDNLTINGINREVVGIVKGAKSFIYPYVFMSYNDTQNILGLHSIISYILIEVENNSDKSHLADEISRIDGIDAYTDTEIKQNTIHWQIFDSMMGVGIGTFVAIGFFVGGLLITLTIYTTTYERIPEFGTLKAIGATKKDINKILFKQVFIILTFSFLVGSFLTALLLYFITNYTLFPVKLTINILLITYFLTLILGMIGSSLAARMVNNIDPAIVFRG